MLVVGTRTCQTNDNMDDNRSTQEENHFSMNGVPSTDLNPSNGHTSETQHEHTKSCEESCESDQLKRRGWRRNPYCFSFVYGFAGLVTSALALYVSSQITTIERQFGLSSRQSGLILSSNDIGFLTTVLFFSYYGNRFHKPRVLAICFVIYGVSGLLACIPQLISNYTLSSSPTRGDNSTVANQNGLCQLSNATSADKCQTTNNSHITTNVELVVAIFVISMLVQGVGKSPRSPLSTTYIDDNGDKHKTGIYLGIISTMSIFGPFIGILIGSAFGKIPVDLSDTTMTPKDSQWVGAWWIGFVLFGTLGIICAIPVTMFPRSLQDKKPNQEETILKQSSKSILEWIKEVPCAVLRILRSPVYTLCLMAMLFVLFGIMGAGSFGPKYIENQFYIPTWKANMLLGIEKVVAGVFGTFFGGFIISRLKLNRRRCLMMIIVLSFITVSFTSLEFLFGCENEVIHGTEDTTRSLESQDCQCQNVPFRVVCGSDGLNYFSPCHAGCTNFTQNVYKGCSNAGDHGQATPGFCETGCPYLIPYMVVSMIGTLSGTMCILPNFMIFLRSVAEDDRALAMGLLSFVMSAFAFLPAPLVYGMIYDYSCEIWNFSCGTRGSCALYDIVRIRFSIVGMEVCCRVAALLLVIAAFIVASKQDKKNKDEEPVKGFPMGALN